MSRAERWSTESDSARRNGWRRRDPRCGRAKSPTLLRYRATKRAAEALMAAVWAALLIVPRPSRHPGAGPTAVPTTGGRLGGVVLAHERHALVELGRCEVVAHDRVRENAEGVASRDFPGIFSFHFPRVFAFSRAEPVGPSSARTRTRRTLPRVKKSKKSARAVCLLGRPRAHVRRARPSPGDSGCRGAFTSPQRRGKRKMG